MRSGDGTERVFAVFGIVTGCLIEVDVTDVRRDNLLISVLFLNFAEELLQAVAEGGTLRQPQRKAGADYYFNDECGSRWPCSEVDDGFKVDDFKCDYYSLVERVDPRLMREGLDTKDWSHDYLIQYPRSYQRDSFDQVDHVEYEWLGVLQ